MFLSGLKNASDMLREKYLTELINCLVEQPLATGDNAIQTLPREEEFVELAITSAEEVDKNWNNSDRHALLRQRYTDMSPINIDQIFVAGDRYNSFI